MKKVNSRLIEIDVIKTISIISVILLHSFSAEYLLEVGSPLHLSNAVPMFMLIAGLNSANSILNSQHEFTFYNEYSKRIHLKIWKILKIFAVFFAVEFCIFVFLGYDPIEILKTLPYGGIGPGSYFIPVFIQHIILFPLVFYVCLKNKDNKPLTFIFFFFIAIIIEYVCVLLSISEELYRVLIVRYIFLIFLGCYLAFHGFNKKFLLLASVFSILYIIGVNYNDLEVKYIPSYWSSQHYPAYMYTVLIFYIFKSMSNLINKTSILNCIAVVSNSTLHIFVFQMLYFLLISKFDIKPELMIGLSIVNVVICVSVGIYLYKFECYLKNLCVSHKIDRL
ncbi:acyltransferase family protein [Vibrio splendidus]